MGDTFYDPNQDIQRPDMLASYIKGAMAPGVVAGQQQELAQGSQQLQSGQLNLNMLKQMMAFRQQRLGQMMPQNTQAGAQPTQGGGSMGGAGGGIENGPQGGVSSQQPYDILDRRSILQNAGYASDMNLFSGKGDPNQPYIDALKLLSDQRIDQQQRTKIALTPHVDALKQYLTDPNADRTMLANAAQGNLDPLKGYMSLAASNGDDPYRPTALSVQRAAAVGINHLAAQSLGTIEPVAMPNPLKTTQRGLGESIQTDPLTGKVTAGAPALATDKFVINGKVVEMPKSQGVASGAQPYDAQLYGADQISPAALEQAYKTSTATGDLTQSLAGRDPIAAAKVSSYIADRAQKDGLTGLQMAAQKQTFAAQGDVVKDYTDPSGKAGGKIQAINTGYRTCQSAYPIDRRDG